MALLNCKAIWHGGSWFYLPPHNCTVSVSRMATVDMQVIPHSHSAAPNGVNAIASVSNRANGWAINFSGQYHATLARTALGWEDDLIDILRDDDGIAATDLAVCLWQDDTAAIDRIYRNCFVNVDPVFEPVRRQIQTMRWSMQLISAVPQRFATAPDSSVPGTSPYAAYLYEET